MEKVKTTDKSKKKTKNNTSIASVSDEEMLSLQLKTEIKGTILITIGILIGLSVYVISQSPFGEVVSKLIFGLCGIAGYCVPVLIIVAGIFQFFRNQIKIKPLAYATIFLFILIILSIINTNFIKVGNLNYFNYIWTSYKSSSDCNSLGGMLGSIITYPLVKLFTAVGTNVVLIASLLIMTIVVFRISIAEIAKNLVNSINSVRAREAEEDEKRRNYYDSLNDLDEDIDCKPDYLKLNKSTSEATEQEYINKANKTRHQNENVDDTEPDLPFNDAEYDVESDAVLNEQMSDADFDKLFLNNKKPADDDSADDILTQFKEMDITTGEIIEDQKNSYQRPPYSLLKKNSDNCDVQTDEAKMMSEKLKKAFASYNVHITISAIAVGPTITRFEIQLAEGVKINKVTELEREIKMALAVEKIRIEAPIPGKNAIGIEIPNKQVSYVYLRDIIDTDDFRNAKSPLTIAVGKDIVGKSVLADIAKMPHLMIAGSTGSGKSVCMNAIIMSLVYKSSPEDIKFILIDPKIVEFGVYSKLPHLLIPVVTDAKRASSALKWAVSEMTVRYNKFSENNVRQIDSYNSLLDEGVERMPRIVIIIDELAELMMSAPKEVEDSITRIAQLGRACGIHLVVATQRPSVDIITGKIKANIVSRIAFAVSDLMNSKVILDCSGAENLIGNGDMLFHPIGLAKPKRVQCAFVSDKEVETAVGFFEEHGIKPTFDEAADFRITAGANEEIPEDLSSGLDELFYEAAKVVIENNRATTSFIQNKLRVGYNRADRMISDMEKLGIVSAPDITKKRDVLMDFEQLEMLRMGKRQ